MTGLLRRLHLTCTWGGPLARPMTCTVCHRTPWDNR